MSSSVGGGRAEERRIGESPEVRGRGGGVKRENRGKGRVFVE